jgi:hypothetical protein
MIEWIMVCVKDYLWNYLGFRHSFLPAVTIAVIGFTFLFATAFAFAIKTLHFQKRGVFLHCCQ